MKIILKKWGNSYGFRLPKSVIDDLDIKENDVLNLTIVDKKIIIKKNNYNEFSIREVAENHYGKPFEKLVNVESGKLLDWGNPVGEEIW